MKKNTIYCDVCHEKIGHNQYNRSIVLAIDSYIENDGTISDTNKIYDLCNFHSIKVLNYSIDYMKKTVWDKSPTKEEIRLSNLKHDMSLDHNDIIYSKHVVYTRKLNEYIINLINEYHTSSLKYGRFRIKDGKLV